MSVATVGARYQIVIPVKERKRVGLKPNQKVYVSIDQERIIIEPIGSQQVRGIMREMRDHIDATDYIRKIRQEWDGRI